MFHTVICTTIIMVDSSTFEVGIGLPGKILRQDSRLAMKRHSKSDSASGEAGATQ